MLRRCWTAQTQSNGLISLEIASGRVARSSTTMPFSQLSLRLKNSRGTETLTTNHAHARLLVWFSCVVVFVSAGASTSAQTRFAAMGGEGLPSWVNEVGARLEPQSARIFSVNA